MTNEWYLEVLKFTEDGRHIPLACYGPFTRESAERLNFEYNTQVLPLLEKASPVSGSIFCGIMDRKRLEVAVRPEFQCWVGGILQGAQYEPNLAEILPQGKWMDR